MLTSDLRVALAVVDRCRASGKGNLPCPFLDDRAGKSCTQSSGDRNRGGRAAEALARQHGQEAVYATELLDFLSFAIRNDF